MARPFSHFVVFAEMRTGSNFLEQNINQFPDLICHGELFNPHFIGGPNKDNAFGISLKERETQPDMLISHIIANSKDAMAGFRFFNDHDPRILKQCLQDPACGKVILTRNALDSYVSRKIAAATNQWKLTNIKHKKTARIAFDLPEFEQHLEETQEFQLLLLGALQTSGQTAFYLNYDDIHDIDVLNGLARFLGSVHQASSLKKNLKRQNPEPLSAKVVNFDAMTEQVKSIDLLNLSRTPTFEPRRGAAVPQYVAGDKTALLFMPVLGGPTAQIKAWMAAHEGTSEAGLHKGFNQNSLRQWLEQHPGFQSFTVLRHPVARAYHGFCRHVVAPQVGGFKNIRHALIEKYGVTVPTDGPETAGYTLMAHRVAFLAYLKFLKANLAEQTSQKIHPTWASQTAILDGARGVAIASHVIHESRLLPSLRLIEEILGLDAIKPAIAKISDQPFSLDEIYRADIEARVREVYARDYLNFGFADWTPAG